MAEQPKPQQPPAEPPVDQAPIPDQNPPSTTYIERSDQGKTDFRPAPDNLRGKD